MSKKNLAKTSIEGGRTRFNKYIRKHSNSEFRGYEHNFLSKVIIDSDLSESLYIKDRKKVRKKFNDKLTPVYKWLQSNCGEKWDSVYSKISSSFDKRTTAGRHIIYDHILKSVDIVPNLRFYKFELGDNKSYYKWDFYVDSSGILRQKELVSHPFNYTIKFDKNKLAKWLDGRIVGKMGTKLYWCIPCDYLLKAEFYISKLIYKYEKTSPIYNNKLIVIGSKSEWVEPYFYNFKRLFSKQDKEFSLDDYKYWDSIPSILKSSILEWSPFNKTFPKARPY
jgi:hypothetical protein